VAATPVTRCNLYLPGGAGFAPHQDAPAYVDFGVEHQLTLRRQGHRRVYQ